jgi:hypothetical protein
MSALRPIHLLSVPAVRGLVITVLCILTGGCANGWPSAHHSQPATAKGSCKTSASRIVHSDCSTTTPASQMSGDELDQEQHFKGGGTAVGGIVTPR